MSNAEFKRVCNHISHKHGTGAEKCTHCSKPAACKDYLVIKDGTWKPLSELADEAAPREAGGVGVGPSFGTWLRMSRRSHPARPKCSFV